MVKEINCSIIQDILPLYIDEIVSKDTKEMVEEHFEQCDQCKQEYELMKQELIIPVEKESLIIKSIQKKWLSKKIMISGLSVLITAVILVSVYLYVFVHATVVPYSEDVIKIETQNENQLVTHYYGVSYQSINMTHPITLEINGEEKNVVFLHYKESIANSHSRKLMDNEQVRNEQEFIFQIPESELVDAVYYADFNSEKFDMKQATNPWYSVLDGAELIWEK